MKIKGWKIMAEDVNTPGNIKPEVMALGVFVIVMVQIGAIWGVASLWDTERTETVFETSLDTDFDDRVITNYFPIGATPQNFTPRSITRQTAGIIEDDYFPVWDANTSAFSIALTDYTDVSGSGSTSIDIPIVIPNMDTYLIKEIDIQVEMGGNLETDIQQIYVGGHDGSGTVNGTDIDEFQQTILYQLSLGNANLSEYNFQSDVELVDSLTGFQIANEFDNHFLIIRLAKFNPPQGWLPQSLTFNVTINGTLQQGFDTIAAFNFVLWPGAIINSFMILAITPWFNPLVAVGLIKAEMPKTKKSAKGGK